MSTIKSKIDDEKGNEILTAQKAWNASCRALLMSGTSLKAIANKVLKAYIGKKAVGEVLPKTEEVPVVDPTPLISPVYSGNPVVELGSRIVGADVTEPEPVIKTEATISERPVKVEDQPVISVGDAMQKQPADQSFQAAEQKKPADIPHIVPPTFATAVVNENIGKDTVAAQVVEEKSKEDIFSNTFESQGYVAQSEAAVEAAINRTTMDPNAVKEPKPELQTPQEFNRESAVDEEANRVSDIYIRTLSNLLAKKEELEKAVSILEESNAAQAKAISNIKAQLSELDGVMRGMEEARKSDIAKIKEALNNQSNVLDPISPVQGIVNVR